MEMNHRTAIRQIEKKRKDVARVRDGLDDLIRELEGLRDSCNRAHDALEEARDALSELA
jgi:predicted  nucleic acid-binding Zn-ribbon protein